MANPIGGLGRVLFGGVGKEVADALGNKIGALPDAISASEAQASKIGALPDSPKVEYVSTDMIADNVAQFNLPRYDVGKFGGDFESGNLEENPDILDAFNTSGKPTLKESIAQEGIKEPVVIKTKQNPRTGRAGDGAVKPAIVNLSGISKKSNADYSFSEFGLLDRIIKPKETAREIQERGGAVFMDFKTGDVSDRRFPSTYTPMRNSEKLRE